MLPSCRVPPRALSDILCMTRDVLRCRGLTDSRRAALDHLRRMYRGSGAMFVGPGRIAPFSPEDAEAAGLARDLPRLYARYQHEDPGLPILRRALRKALPQVLTSERLFRDHRLYQTRYYREVMKPLAMHHALAFLLADERQQLGVIVVYRSCVQPGFDAGDVAAAHAAIATLSSALRAMQRLEPPPATSSGAHARGALYEWAGSAAGPAPFGLSPREAAVARLLLEGHSHAGIAVQLGNSVHTVAHHVASVYQKVGVGTRAALVARLSRAAPRPDACRSLTARQRQLVAELLGGASNKEIAARLGLSVATVSNHLQKIYRALGVHDRLALMRQLALREPQGDQSEG